MKKKIKVEIVDYDKEKKKAERKERVQKFWKASKGYLKTGVTALGLGTGVGLVIVLNKRYF